MNNSKTNRWTISVEQNLLATKETWVGLVEELPDFRAECGTRDDAFSAIADHFKNLIKIGDETDPIMIQYILNPTLELYLECRKNGLYPDYPHFGGNDSVGNVENYLSEYGIDQSVFLGVLDADEDIIQNLSLKLIENICKSKTLKKSGETHVIGRGLVLPDELMDWLICCMLDGLRWNRIEEIPVDLVVLIRARLVPGDSKIETKIHAKRMRQQAVWIAASAIAAGNNPSFRFVAKHLKVEPSTVKRWFSSEDEFKQEAKRRSAAFDKTGLLKPLFPNGRPVLHPK